MARNSWQFDWIDGGEANAPTEIRRRWNSAFESHGNIWQFGEFFHCWDETMAEVSGQKPILLFASDCDGHQVIYPLYARRQKVYGVSFTIVEPIGGAIYCDYQDPLSIGGPMREIDWRYFWAGLQKAASRRFGRFSELRMYRLSNQTAVNVRGVKASTVSPFIPLDGVSSLQTLLTSRGRNLRENISRLLRRLEDRGGYVIRRISAHSLREDLSQFFQCYAEQWGQGGRPHVMQNPEARLYYSSLAEAAARSAKLHFTVLEVDGEPWHWHLGLEHRDVLLWYKITYNIRFRQFSPGMLHLALLVEEGLARGIKRLDLGCGPEEYKFKWTDQCQELFGGRTGGLTPLADAAKRAFRSGRAFRNRLSNLRGSNDRSRVEA